MKCAECVYDIKEKIINDGYMWQESKNELSINKIIDELENIEPFLFFDKQNKEVGIVLPDNYDCHEVYYLTNNELNYIQEIKKELGWIE